MESELDRLRKKVENFPSASLYTRLAELSRQAGDLAGAESACKRCMREFPRSAQAYVILADLRIAAGNKVEARQLVATAVEKEPRSYAAQRLAADLAETPDQALHHLRLILAFKPGDAPTVQRIQELGGNASPPPPGVITVGSSASSSVATATSPTRVVHAPASSTVAGRLPPDGPIPMPTPAPATATATLNTAIRATVAPKTGILDALCGEAGVRGAVIADVQGRVVNAKGLAAGQEELLAALASDIGRSAGAALVTASLPTPGAWNMVAAHGQVLCFSRGSLAVVVVADPGVRPAMLELRARQALIDLGGG